MQSPDNGKHIKLEKNPLAKYKDFNTAVLVYEKLQYKFHLSLNMASIWTESL